MGLMWTDSLDVALALMDKYPDVDPTRINFVDLRDKILQLEEFEGQANHCGERVMEAIQLAWMEEYV